jgi:Protein of unknown function (DUF2975)
MRRLTILWLRGLIVLLFAWLLLGQALVLPQWAASTAELNPEAAHLRAPVLVLCILGLATVQVALVCIWRLLTMVRHDTVFTTAAFRDVDVVIGSAGVATLLSLTLIFVIPTALMPPWVGIVLLATTVGGGGVTLLVLVLRALLAKAVALDSAATTLRAELDEVI